MGDRKIPRAEDVFTGGPSGRTNLFKKKKAPAAPSGPLPKIGNYQPKSLMTPKPGGVTPDQREMKEEQSFHRHHEESKPKQLIMGDKDVPIKITETDHDSAPVAPPRRKRRAPSVPNGETTGGDKVSSNPLYGRSISNISDDDGDSIDVDFEEQGGVMDFGPSSGGRSYDRRNDDFSNISTNDTIAPDYDDEVADIDFGIGIDDEPVTSRRRNTRQNGEADMPYIPPPDYDDEERTFDFDDEGGQVFKEYQGEDYGKYLDDDEDYRLQHRQRLARAERGGVMHMGPRPGARQPPGKKYKKKKKGAPSEADKRNTIRDFTFTDTKIGWGDRTVKSTSAKGRYIKREKERNRIDTKSHFNTQTSKGPSYEDFLLGKKELDSPNSSDSGVDTGDHRRNGTLPNGESNRGFVPDDGHERAKSDIFYNSQPKQMRSDMDDYGKASLWKRLTWRFKKNVNISKMGDR